MGRRKAVFYSPDPLDQFRDPRDRLDDPWDQANEKRQMDMPSMLVRQVRKRLHMSQRQFAGCFGFPLATLRHWECGNRRPSGSALVLLHVLRTNPQAVLRAVRNARLRDPDCLAKMQQKKSSRAPPGLGGFQV